MVEQHVVLVVEDEFLIREDIKQHLIDCGYCVLDVGNAEDAIRVIETRPDIDLVFTDVRMPGEIDGIGLAEWVSQNHPQMRVLVTSGHAARDTAIVDLCKSEVLVKPYALQTVAAKIEEILAARDAATDDEHGTRRS